MRIFSYEELDELGEGLIRQYHGKEAERTCCVNWHTNHTHTEIGRAHV